METIMKKLRILILISVSALVNQAVARDNIVETISRDSIIRIVQPGALSARLFQKGDPVTSIQQHAVSNAKESGMPAVAGGNQMQRVAGFRVQVFSDNNSRTAKSEARNKSKAINDAIPHYRTYVTYDAPYWRLKVGDFRSRTDAEEAADEIKRLFPSYSREVRVVRDRINVKM